MSVISLRVSSYAGNVAKEPFFRCFLARYAAVKNEVQEIEIVPAPVDSVMSEEELEKICDKSRLLSGHRNLVHDRPPYSESKHRFHDTVKYKRRMYGRYGDASNVDPGLAWPTAEDIEDVKEYERIMYPLTIQEMRQNAIDRFENEQRVIHERQQKIDDNMKKLNGWLNDVRVKAAKKLQDAHEAKEKKARLIEEVKKHFGYKIDPKDDRFKEMLAKREKEEKKKVREEKKKLREEKLLNALKTN